MKKFIISLVLASTLAVPALVGAQAFSTVTQVNNLTITDVSYDQGYTAIIKANNFTIRVSPYTTLLLRNRALTNISTFIAGDKINVYGYFDPASNTFDALIMRDLSQSPVRYYTQVNNLTVQGVFGSSLVASSQLGAQYTINISGSTSLLYRDRRLMPIYEVQTGDTINVYGLFNPATLAFDAVVLRDLSRPGVVIVPPPMPPQPGNSTPVITAISGPTNLSVGQTGTWAISAYDPDNNGNNLTYSVTWGDEYNYAYGASAAMAPQSNMQTGTFTHSYGSAGSYTVRFTVRDISGLSAVSTLTVNVGGGGSVTAPYISQLSPSFASVGTGVTIYGSGFTSSGNTIRFGNGVLANYSSSNNSIFFTVPSYLSPYCAPNMLCAQYVQQVTPGSYSVWVENASGISNSVMFTVQ